MIVFHTAFFYEFLPGAATSKLLSDSPVLYPPEGNYVLRTPGECFSAVTSVPRQLSREGLSSHFTLES